MPGLNPEFVGSVDLSPPAASFKLNFPPAPLKSLLKRLPEPAIQKGRTQRSDHEHGHQGLFGHHRLDQ